MIEANSAVKKLIPGGSGLACISAPQGCLNCWGKCEGQGTQEQECRRLQPWLGINITKGAILSWYLVIPSGGPRLEWFLKIPSWN